MPNPPPTPQEQLLIRLEIFEERLGELEDLVLSSKPELEERLARLENLVLNRPKPTAKPARNWMLGLLTLAVVLSSTPIDITAGGVAYKSGGFPAEGFVAIAGIISGLYYGWDKYQKEGFTIK